MKWRNANDKPQESGVYYCRVTEGESAYTAVIEFSMGFWCVDNEFIDVVEWLDEYASQFERPDNESGQGWISVEEIKKIRNSFYGEYRIEDTFIKQIRAIDELIGIEHPTPPNESK